MDIKNKVAVVTGASDGLGKQISLKLAKEGASLALVARNEEKLNEVKKEAEKLGSPKVICYPCDIQDKEQIKKTVQKIEVDFNEVQILLNIAGIWQKLNLLEDIPEGEVDSVINSDLTGMIHMTRLMLPILKRQDEAIIINDSSKSGVTAQPGQSVYTAAKWGVRGFTEVLKEDLKDTNVRVAAIYQGGTDTEMFNKTGEHFNQEKFIKPEELANVIIFMLTRPSGIWLHDVRVEH
ncbi:oxidoreductase [Candidatus Woesebacteria bacterium CG22_combo_CG10-13_8_21_14_all_39_10]|uniref:NAD(P)-dependent oxidoreductase n=4 Tax=Candidatus Woeseibacteriota TaxID=1752722 RepID=A0A2M7XA15_9BACT|nr:MAG: oxidoreductase [Candidatus Woesebacteria bacterium CG22_combo_CG10-13_8_21_14_all_39_10]PIU71983.1 MAG: NAD(P)-dependent oxidoreductase [Candidatus Woesebacteria bacterium CG06_land_8_20_14_3_00_39_27]PIZ49301.1 MAG: NAD(P)-dependent oxidoreductase [Candidatus Woesebacteria bacterium CG_4_10_14_0_2_um_filter_39_14]PJA42969.1 MAG: NAD(P)-dependent oxidoreductase [Candidatus Woesebacteria bacterium CG_4_9_14_3_um_filter_39_10]